jgi:hypothetical protein
MAVVQQFPVFHVCRITAAIAYQEVRKLRGVVLQKCWYEQILVSGMRAWLATVVYSLLNRRFQEWPCKQ